MSDSELRPDELQFCPICQIPKKYLKIIFALHISMCDVQWNELEECTNGVHCQSKNIFHYRDFSHRILAIHRENICNKRKRNEINEKTLTINKRAHKENKIRTTRRRTTAKYNKEADDDDNIFMTSIKKMCNTHAKTTKIEDSIISITKDKSVPVEHLSVKQKSNCVEYEPVKLELISVRKTSTEGQESGENSPNTAETLCNNIQNVINDLVAEDDFLIKRENKWDVDENAVECEVTFEDTNQDDISFNSSDWEFIEERINESVKKKEKCKAQWNNIFKNNVTVAATAKLMSTPVKKQKTKRSGMFSNDNKVCPNFKKIPGTGFAVDAFQFGNIPGITTYFLTHFHLDHYIGLKKSFSHPIYCSLITANLVKKKLRVDEKYLHLLEVNFPIVIQQVEVTCFDANHCPGALIILFRLLSGEQFLHVGDFRACPEMEDEPGLQQANIDRLYLDTTYFNPQYVFPTQQEVVDRVKDIVRELSLKYNRALFVCGTYLIGKEKVFLGMLDVLKCKLWALPPKVDVFRCINNEVILSALTKNATEAKIHVLPMNHLRFDKLQKHLLESEGAFTHVFAFRPSGWEMGHQTSDDWINSTSTGNVTVYGVPYSEHSNFEELCRFIKFIKADKVIPTVQMKGPQMYRLLKSQVDSYKNGAKQLRIDQFISK